MAIDFQVEQVAILTSRLKKLNTSLNRPSSHLLTRDSRLPNARRPYSSFSYGQLTATNALNGERSAHKLKLALLSVRQQPLLNRNATTAPAAPLAFTTPTKLVKAGPQSPSLGFDLKPFSTSETAQSLAFNPGALDGAPHDMGMRRRAGSRGTTKGNRSPNSGIFSTSVPSPPAPPFDWGTLPIIPQKKSLPFGFSMSPSRPSRHPEI